MQIQRLFVRPDAIDTTRGEVTVAGDQANQLLKVNRLRAGDLVHILNGKGLLHECAMENIDTRKKTCLLKILVTKDVSYFEPAVEVTFALALIKPTRFEWALEKLAEIGARRVVPVQTERTVVRVAEPEGQTTGGGATKLARWNTIMREASEQCERAVIPDVVAPQKLPEFLESFSNAGKGKLIICTERSDAIELSDLLTVNATISGEASLVVLIGPEGGFSESELALASKHQAQAVSLGRRILRAETAAVYASSIIMSHLDKQRSPA